MDDLGKRLKKLEDRVGKLEKYIPAPISDDELLPEVKKTVIQYNFVSASLLQRRFNIGYSRSARLLDILESEGFVGKAEGAKPRKVLKKS